MRTFRNLAFVMLCTTAALIAKPAPIVASGCSSSWTSGDWADASYSGSCDASCGEAMYYATSVCGSQRIMLDFSCGDVPGGIVYFSFGCHYEPWFD